MDKNMFLRAAKFFHFSLVGITTFSVQIFLTLILTEWAGLAYYVSYALALLVARLLNFLFNTKYTFRAEGRMIDRLKRFALLAIIYSFTSWILVIVSVEYIHLHYMMSVILVTFLLSFLTYMMQERWVFANVEKY
jgi:putative flippase GtrA